MKRFALLAACVITAASCGDSTAPSTPSTIVLSRTAVHFDAIGSAQGVTATVQDQKGNPMPEATVVWTSSSASAAVVAEVPSTGALITGVSAGAAIITATAGNATNTVAVDIVQTPTTISRVGGDGQSAAIFAPLTTPIRVQLTDRTGFPAPGQVVTFVVTLGGGTLAQSSVITDVSGMASTTWSLGSRVGTQRVVATNAAAGSTTFSATGTFVVTGPTLSVTSGDNQAVMAGTAVSTRPAVTLRDAGGSPVVGALVTFAVSAGGGSVTGATATTNSSGIATVGSWTLGTEAAFNTLTATSPTVTGSATVIASGCGGGGGTGFGITVCYLSTMTPVQHAAFESAAAKWASIITGDLSDVTTNVFTGACGSDFNGVPTPGFNFTIDDVVIYATIDPIDGPSEILGQAGPCAVRGFPSRLPYMGSMEFDEADMASLETKGQLNAVILHEMGHVLGFGTRWESFDLLRNPVIDDVLPSRDTYFSGANALIGFNNIGGTTYTKGLKVPVENLFDYGDGTYNAHWRESVLKNELMTGFINTGTNPLSELTVRSMADMGYAVNAAAADPFFLTLTAARANENSIGAAGTIKMGNDIKPLPQYMLGPNGQMIRIR